MVPYPSIIGLLKRFKGRNLRGLPIEEVFTGIYRGNVWGSRESASGAASTLESTRSLRSVLPDVLARLGVRSLLDIPCGDYHWMKEVELGVDSYIGADIVDELVEHNGKQWTDARHRFLKLDVTRDPLPRVDLVFCRDCLPHLSFADALQALANLHASGSTYLLTTTFTEASRRNIDIVTGQWRPINLQQAPFHLPPPILTIPDRFGASGRYDDRCMALWSLDNLPGTAR